MISELLRYIDISIENEGRLRGEKKTSDVDAWIDLARTSEFLVRSLARN